MNLRVASLYLYSRHSSMTLFDYAIITIYDWRLTNRITFWTMGVFKSLSTSFRTRKHLSNVIVDITQCRANQTHVVVVAAVNYWPSHSHHHFLVFLNTFYLLTFTYHLPRLSISFQCYFPHFNLSFFSFLLSHFLLFSFFRPFS